MDASTSLSLVQTVLNIMELPIWKEIELVLGVDTEVKKLKDTVSTINDFLLDADEHERQQLGGWSNVEHGRLQKLKEALYQAEDLFDEVTTVAHRKQLKSGNKLCNFFSCSNLLPSAFTWTREIKRIREMLENIVNDNRHAFALRQPVAHWARLNQTDSSSFICEEDVIIGRDEDKQRVISMLVDTTIVEDVSFINIVGIGGLGKTALAQLVYNDWRIDKEFSLKMWVCVSDDFNDEALLGKILSAATKVANVGGLSLDLLQQQLRQQLEGKKYLLVLDDIWNEDVNKWRMLRNMLIIGGARGSRVVVTTRSRRVAEIVGGQTHELEGLSEKDSWNLFEKMTLEPGQHQMEDHLVEIGKEIIKKCASVPLALRVIGSLLRGNKSESEWQKFKDIDLANIERHDNGIIPVLKISYYNLPYHLKSCFSYCATFPKDYKILKEKVIRLWMAQGFIRPDVGQSLEQAGEKYFKQLLQRCFFQDVKQDKFGEIISCKMHDLIHDVATEVAGIEILSSNYNTSRINERTRHLFADMSVSLKDVVMYTTKMTKMRTLVFANDSDGIRYPFIKDINVKHLVMRYLRVLDLHNSRLRTLPNSIGKLLLLRYLDLSDNYLIVLPKSFRKLFNLQTLNLRNCEHLETLPKDMSKLVNLRQLDIHGCYSLRHMPPGMERMTSLQKLTAFVAGGTNEDGIGIGELRDLKYFTNHTEVMQIRVRNGARYGSVEAREEQCLFNTKHLKNIEILWDDSVRNNDAEATLEAFQPCSNLRILLLEGYPGARFPSWGAEGGSSANLNSCLPNLVEIKLIGCTRLVNLPLMSQLRHLKVLTLAELPELEYVESSNTNGVHELMLFPSLEKLKLEYLPKLKGWWEPSSEEESNGEQQEQGSQPRNEMLTTRLQSYAFPRLSRLTMIECNSLTTLPRFPALDHMEIGRIRFKEYTVNFAHAKGGTYSLLEHRSSCMSFHDLDRESPFVMSIYSPDEVYNVNSALAQVIQGCSELRFEEIKDLETWTAGEMFRSGMVSSIRSLVISRCQELKSLSGLGMWKHFTALERLELYDLDKLELEDEDDVNSTSSPPKPWIFLSPTLRSLKLHELPNLVTLPAVLRHLTRAVSMIFWALCEISKWTLHYKLFREKSICDSN